MALKIMKICNDMNMDEKTLKKCCSICDETSDSQFVGIKKIKNKIQVFFPLGYQLGVTDDEVRCDIRLLINVLIQYGKQEDLLFIKSSSHFRQNKTTLIKAYFWIIEDFLSRNGKYYEEAEYILRQSDRGNINWTKTITKERPLIQEKNSVYDFVYTRFVVRQTKYDDQRILSMVHRYCVSQAFLKFGWLFTSFLPKRINRVFDKQEAIALLRKKLAITNNDNRKLLYKSMLDILIEEHEDTQNDSFMYGTNRFEYVWEAMIDTVFGISNKKEYFPEGEWKLAVNPDNTTSTSVLLSDTIMTIGMESSGKRVYVIDAKYYKYGITKATKDLPNTSSILKQIAYGEYIENEKGIPENLIHNAFLMPYNSINSKFSSTEGEKKAFLNIGEATAKWRKDNKNYDKIQGVLVDTKMLMQASYTGGEDKIKRVLAEVIEKKKLILI